MVYTSKIRTVKMSDEVWHRSKVASARLKETMLEFVEKAVVARLGLPGVETVGGVSVNRRAVEEVVFVEGEGGKGPEVF